MAQKMSGKQQLAKFEIGELEGLERGKCTGSGSFGAVYRVKVGGVTRIGKRLHDILLASDVRPSEKDGIRERFYNECLLLSKLDHPCIVQFVGVHFHGLNRADVTLVMECLHTDLDRFLDPEERPNIPLSIKLSVLLDVSAGLHYLHNQLEEPLVHRDLKPENILLTNDVRAKIADLGVSKLLKNYPHRAAIQTKCPGSLAYMPPEALIEAPKYDTSLDIFSYGHLALYTAIQIFPQVYNMVRDPKMTSAIRIGESEILRRKKWMDLLGKDHCLRGIICQCLRDDYAMRPKTQDLNNSMKTLCVTHPKVLKDFVRVMEGKEEVKKLKDETKSELSKINDLQEEKGILQHELVAEKQNCKHEKERVDKLECAVTRLHHENEHLEEQLRGYDRISEEVKMLKDSAANMLKKLRTLLGKSEAEHPESDKVDLEYDNITKKLDELMDEVMAGRVQHDVYKEDFEEERKEREEAATKKDEEITAMQLEFSKTVQERDVLKTQVKKAHQDLAKARQDLEKAHLELTNKQTEVEKSKKLLQDINKKVDKSVKTQKKGTDDKVKQEDMEQVQVQHELTEVKEQLEKAYAEKATLTDEYNKRVDHFKAQLQESNARNEEYHMRLKQSENELAYCQKDLKTREEYERNTAEMAKAQYESELSTLNIEIGRLKREKADMEVQLCQQLLGALTPETASLISQLEKDKEELHKKYMSLLDKYDVMFQHKDKLVSVLRQNNNPMPSAPSAKTPPQAVQHASTLHCQDRVAYDGAGKQFNRQSDPNKSVTSHAAIGHQPTPQDQQLRYGQYQRGVGGVSPTSSPPTVLRAGEGAGVTVGAGELQPRPNEHFQQSYLPQEAYQGQQNMYLDQQGAVGGSGGGVPGNYSQSYHPQSAPSYGSNIPGNQTYGGMGMRLAVSMGVGQQELMTPEPESRRHVASGPHENALIKGINTEIHNVAAGVGRVVGNNPEMDSLSPQAPFDPNLICPMCRMQHRIGEIQKYRKHLKYCQGT